MAAWPPVDDVEPSRVHDCHELKEFTGARSHMSGPSPREWGESIARIVEFNGIWWAVSGDPLWYRISRRL